MTFNRALSVLLPTLVLITLVLFGLKTFQPAQNTVYYRVCSLGEAIFSRNSHDICSENKTGDNVQLLKGTPTSSLQNAEETVTNSPDSTAITSEPEETLVIEKNSGPSFINVFFHLRYLIFLPAYEASEHFEIDLEKTYSLNVTLYFFLLALSLSILSTRYLNANPLVCNTVLLVVFIFMNGRIAPSFVGYSFILLSFYLRNGRPANDICAFCLSSIGFYLALMSSGFFVAVATVFFLGHFSPIRKALFLQKPFAGTTFLALSAFFIGPAVLVVFVSFAIKLQAYYGGTAEMLFGVLTHGFGRVILVDKNLLVFALFTGLATLGVGYLLKEKLWRSYKAARMIVPNIATYVFIIAVPSTFVVAGYTAATPAVLGVALLAGEIFRYAHVSLKSADHNKKA